MEVKIIVSFVHRDLVNVDPELWRDAKIEAIKRGITVTELFEESLRKEVSKSKQFEANSKLQGGKLRSNKL